MLANRVEPNPSDAWQGAFFSKFALISLPFIPNFATQRLHPPKVDLFLRIAPISLPSIPNFATQCLPPKVNVSVTLYFFGHRSNARSAGGMCSDGDSQFCLLFQISVTEGGEKKLVKRMRCRLWRDGLNGFFLRVVCFFFRKKIG